MSLKITHPLVSVDWLKDNLDTKNLIVLDCTIPKVTSDTITLELKTQIKGAVFFDIQNSFLIRKQLFQIPFCR